MEKACKKNSFAHLNTMVFGNVDTKRDLDKLKRSTSIKDLGRVVQW